MEEHNGENPQNARININYTGKKPKVKFSYPIDKKNTASRGSMLVGIVLICTILYWLGFLATSPSILDSNYDKTELRKFAECSASHSIETLTNYSLVRNDLCKPGLRFFSETFKSLGILFFCILILPCLIYFPFRKHWNKLYPDYQALTTRKKYRKFNNKDIEQDKEGNYYLELPVFANVVCDFNATKDFSKQLKEFEIREHKFYSYRLKTFKTKTKKIKKRKINEWLWYARWYFKEKPQIGFLEVIFK